MPACNFEVLKKETGWQSTARGSEAGDPNRCFPTKFKKERRNATSSNLLFGEPAFIVVNCNSSSLLKPLNLQTLEIQRLMQGAQGLLS